MKFQPKGNKFVEKDGLLYCYHIDGTLLFFTDIENKEKVEKWNWCKAAAGYCATRTNGKQIAVHRFLTNAPEGTVVDHINRDKTDNRMANLRITNKSVNSFNSKIRTTNTSGYTGIYFRKDTKRWSADIKKAGIKYALGCYGTKEEAIAARKKGEKELYGN